MILTLFFEFLAILVFVINWTKKGMILWQKLSLFGLLEWWQPAGTLLGQNVAY